MWCASPTAAGLKAGLLMAGSPARVVAEMYSRCLILVWLRGGRRFITLNVVVNVHWRLYSVAIELVHGVLLPGINHIYVDTHVYFRFSSHLTHTANFTLDGVAVSYDSTFPAECLDAHHLNEQRRQGLCATAAAATALEQTPHKKRKTGKTNGFRSQETLTRGTHLGLPLVSSRACPGN
ncbi:hypothetical protein O3P69_014112 [Scylla paramamosain]|uniref:Uncharacterized protein n=1 Tax=Scylla paramamosain TaxID=85552 RepID=A0AAW0ST49_SCYPA